MNENYNQIKEESLKGNITDKLFPYLWEYVEYICNKNKVKNLCEDYQKFVQHYTLYLNTFILNKIPNTHELFQKLPDIFKYLDTIHLKATEK